MSVSTAKARKAGWDLIQPLFLLLSVPVVLIRSITWEEALWFAFPFCLVLANAGALS